MDFTCTASREAERNNPFGISESSTYKWEGVNFDMAIPNMNGHLISGVDNKLNDKLMIFKTWQDGMNACMWLLKGSYFDKGINTPRRIYNVWSGDSPMKAKAQDRAENGVQLAKIMACNPDEVLTFCLNDLLDLCQAMLRFEDSTKVFETYLIKIPEQMYQDAISYAIQKTQAVPGKTGLKIGGSSMPDLTQPPAQAQVVYVTKPSVPLSQMKIPGTNIPVDAAIAYASTLATEAVNGNYVTDPHLSLILHAVAFVLGFIGHGLQTDGV